MKLTKPAVVTVDAGFAAYPGVLHIHLVRDSTALIKTATVRGSRGDGYSGLPRLLGCDAGKPPPGQRLSRHPGRHSACMGGGQALRRPAPSWKSPAFRERRSGSSSCLPDRRPSFALCGACRSEASSSRARFAAVGFTRGGSGVSWGTLHRPRSVGLKRRRQGATAT